MVPKAINSVIWRIGLFYVGSVVLLVLLLPWNAYRPDRAVRYLLKAGRAIYRQRDEHRGVNRGPLQP